MTILNTVDRILLNILILSMTILYDTYMIAFDTQDRFSIRYGHRCAVPFSLSCPDSQSGSVSGFAIRISVRIRNPDPDSQSGSVYGFAIRIRIRICNPDTYLDSQSGSVSGFAIWIWKQEGKTFTKFRFLVFSFEG